jgi:hypothetical protein
MPAGTITLTNNSTAVTGAGTAFTTELKANDFIVVVVGGTTYTLGVSAIGSASALTLTTAYGGPTTSGLSWTPIPNGTLVGITAQIAADTARAIRGLNFDKANWQQVYSGSGNITVSLPDGSAFTGPSWKYLADNMATKVSGAVPVAQGGTGDTTAAGARANLGLGSSATRNAYSTSGDMLSVGDFGFGSQNPTTMPQDNTANYTNYPNGFYTALTDWVSSPAGIAGQAIGIINTGLHSNSSTTWRGQIALSYSSSGRMFFRCTTSGTWNAWREAYHTGNTTKASDGTLKAASPVARIVKSQEENQRDDVAEEGYTWCGCGTANAEAEGINISRLDTGVYLLTGSAGLASEGWQLLPPMDPGGMGELGVVEAEETESGGITVRLFKRRYAMGDDGDIVKTKGVPMDVPDNSWIDIRLDMPADSIWNKKTAEAEKAGAQENQGDMQS